MKKWYHENCWHLIKPKQQIETCKTTEMTKTKRLKRNEPNDSNEKTKNDQNSTKKKSEIKITPRGHLNYVLLLIYLMGKFSYLYITISLTWDVEGTFLKKYQYKGHVHKCCQWMSLSVSSSPNALVFNLAGVPSWKLHINVKFYFQLLAWWKKIKFR